MSDSDESDLDDYFPSSSGSETSEYDTTSDEEDSDCDYSLCRLLGFHFWDSQE